MDIIEKAEGLRKIDTKSIILKLHEYEDELENALTAEADFKSQNHNFLGSGDCQEVKNRLAELAALAPETNGAGKKMTIAERDNWLQRQRTANKELSEAIKKQRQVAFLTADHEIKVEMARRRLTSTIAILALRTAQINFLAS